MHDAIDLIYHERSLRTLELLFHHVSVIVALMCCVLTKRFVAVCACGLLMEVRKPHQQPTMRPITIDTPLQLQVNSIFLHSRSLLNLNGVDKLRLIYRCVSVGNIGTFIVFRLSTTVFLIVWDCLHYHVMTSFYFAVLFFVMFSMLIVNLILFYRVRKFGEIEPKGKI
jgi:hypothetical protein